MNVKFTYTRHQTPRGSIPDAETRDALYLLKNVSEMRLTYQIKLLAFMAHSKKKKLILRLPACAKIHQTLRDYIRELSGLVKIERV
jgi:hypothetical protein